MSQEGMDDKVRKVDITLIDNYGEGGEKRQRGRNGGRHRFFGK